MNFALHLANPELCPVRLGFGIDVDFLVITVAVTLWLSVGFVRLTSTRTVDTYYRYKFLATRGNMFFITNNSGVTDHNLICFHNFSVKTDMNSLFQTKVG
jgi:hypothetical protein